MVQVYSWFRFIQRSGLVSLNKPESCIYLNPE
jgi:hypothetical protein